jgi:pimeloyl-ACP methyl ester carboxylesterase
VTGTRRRIRPVVPRYPNGVLEIVPGAGHFIQLDRPDVVVDRVREIVERVRAPDTT